MRLDPHRLAEERSLALHEAVAQRIRHDATVIVDARRRVEGWLRDGSVARPYAEAWRAILAGGLDDIVLAITDPGERARALRQCSPFAGALDPRERWRILDEVRARVEAGR